MPTYNLDVPADLTVDVKLPIGLVEIVAGPPGIATVELTSRGGLGEQLLDESRVEVSGDRLIVHAPDRGTRGLGLFRARVSGSLHARITIPEGARLDADVAAADIDAPIRFREAQIRSASGDIRLGDVTGPASVHTASGDLQLGDVDGDLSAATASGDVRIGDVGGTATVRTASGDVAVGSLGGDARVRSVSGDVAVRELTSGDIDVASTSGDLDLRVAPGLQIHLDVSSVSGDLRSDLGGGDESRSQVDLSLRARSVSGDITISRARTAGRAQVV